MVQLGKSGLLYSHVSCPRLRCKFCFVLFLLWAGKVVGVFAVDQRHILLSFPPSGWRTPLVLKGVKGLPQRAGWWHLVNRLGESWPQAVLRQGSGLSGLRGGNLAQLLVNRCSCLSPASLLPGELLREKGSGVLMGVPLDPWNLSSVARSGAQASSVATLPAGVCVMPTVCVCCRKREDYREKETAQQ